MKVKNKTIKNQKCLNQDYSELNNLPKLEDVNDFDDFHYFPDSSF